MIVLGKRVNRHDVTMALMVLLFAGCASTSPAKSQLAADAPGCLHACPTGFQCSTAVIQGIKTGLCVSGPVECKSDLDCLNSAALPGTVPLRYACDKHSGSHPDKTGSAVVSDRGTCMPTERTGME